MSVQVFDEVSPLQRVLVHEPGPEVDAMVPSMMEELLFDDILYGDRARDEHARFRRVLQLHGVEVLDAGALLTEALADADVRSQVMETVVPGIAPATRTWLSTLDAPAFAERLVVGERRQDWEATETTGGGVDELFAIPPLPNYCFQRDTQIVLGNRVIFASMASPARQREAALSRVIFDHHPDLRGTEVLFDPWTSSTADFDGEAPQLEGGDVLVLGPDIVAVGLSERTNRTAIRRLAKALDGQPHPRWIVVVELPKQRATMHLDTLFTMVDHGQCLVFPPLLARGIADAPSTWVLDRHQTDADFTQAGPLLSTLADLGLDLEPIPCGGADPVDQHREQWTDGANALAVAPGVITLFDRNVVTLDELDRRGFAIVRAEDLLLGHVEPHLDRKVCIALRSNEISRARGGPHCLSHPLVRSLPRTEGAPQAWEG